MYKEWLVDNVLGKVVPYQTGDRMFHYQRGNAPSPTKWAGMTRNVSYQKGERRSPITT